MDDVVGLIPAAGQSKRLAPLPLSKELFPVGFWQPRKGGDRRPKVVSHYLIEKMQMAGISRMFIILREGKWDIPAYLKDGSQFGAHIAYLMLGLPYGVPYTIDQAFPFVQGKLVAFGFPDILFEPADAFACLLSRIREIDADVLLGLFPTNETHKVDMVGVSEQGEVQQIIIRPERCSLRSTWGIAVWRPSFTEFLHRHLTLVAASAAEKPELSMGQVFIAAMESGMRIDGMAVSGAAYVDIGTPADLEKALRDQSELS